jgi:hypothetical protein
MATREPIESRDVRLMTLLATLFLGRVLGQLIVSRRHVRFLPPMEQWQSGLLPYPVLFLSQGIILGIQATIIGQARRGEGVLVKARPRLGGATRALSVVYFGGMIVRYAVSMQRHPERRWLGKTIPIWFHCVLATYLFVYARLLRRSARD